MYPVEVQDGSGKLVVVLEDVVDEVGADEAGTARDEDALHGFESREGRSLR